MAVKLLPNRDLGQVNTLKRSQQGFGRRTVGGSFRITTNPSWSLPVPGTAYHSCTYNKVGSIFLQRQSHGDSSAVAELALYKHVSVVVFNQASRNRQP